MDFQTIFFKVTYNHHRDVSDSIAHEVRDREDFHECECVLRLPASYTEEGDPTPLIISCHGAGGRVCKAEEKIGGVASVANCVEAGFAALDVCGSEPHGLTMGCPAHIMALYKGYRYAVRHYNLSDRVLVAGESMGGQTAMNFANAFPSYVIAVGLFYPRLNMDGVTVNGHYCIGSWDKEVPKLDGTTNTRKLLLENFSFPTNAWYDENTVGFNPHRTHACADAEGQRVVIPPCPIKIWHGLEDTTIDYVMTEEYVNSVRRSGSYIELHLLEGTGHKKSDAMREERLYWFRRFADC